MGKRLRSAWVWMDLEMTGLNPRHDGILEIATLVTTPALEIVARGPELVVWQSEELLATMDAWNQKHHGESGLLERVRASTVDIAEADARTAAFLRPYVEAGSGVLCGNSIWQDRRFVEAYMPETVALLHYRMVDVSSVKLLAKTWYPSISAYKKSSPHRALADIEASIDELRYYRAHIFKDGV